MVSYFIDYCYNSSVYARKHGQSRNIACRTRRVRVALGCLEQDELLQDEHGNISTGADTLQFHSSHQLSPAVGVYSGPVRSHGAPRVGGIGVCVCAGGEGATSRGRCW